MPMDISFAPNQSISEFHTLFRQANDDHVSEAPALNRMFRFHFRLVEPADAAFICTLRSDPGLNRHLSPSSPDVEAQRRWIESYKAREAEGREFYFVIVADGADQGVVRMYDFREIDGRKSFCWGSWIIKPPRPPGLVTFSAICIYELGFNTLGFERSHFDVRRENTAVTGFHHRAGAKMTGEDELNVYFEFPSSHFSGLLAASMERIKAGRVPTISNACALQKILAKVWSFFAVQAWPDFEPKPFIRARISPPSAREGVSRGAPLNASGHY